MEDAHPMILTQDVIWRIPCTIHKMKNKADVILSHIKHKDGYEAVDIRLRRNNAHEYGPGFSKQGIRLRLDEAVSMWKALGKLLEFIEE